MRGRPHGQPQPKLGSRFCLHSIRIIDGRPHLPRRRRRYRMWVGEKMMTLDGVTVIDLTQNVAGPYCTQLLGDFGANVIKIERPDGGDDVRRFAPLWHDESSAYLSYNRNKTSICIDLTDSRGPE